MSEEPNPFPKSDAPARLLVVLAASLTNATILIETTILTAGYRFKDPAYGANFGAIAWIGLLFLLLLTAILAITRSPTRGFAYKSLLVTFLIICASLVIAPLRLD